MNTNELKKPMSEEDQVRALHALKVLEQFAKLPEIQAATDGAFDPEFAVGAAQALRKRYLEEPATEYAEAV